MFIFYQNIRRFANLEVDIKIRYARDETIYWRPACRQAGVPELKSKLLYFLFI